MTDTSSILDAIKNLTNDEIRNRIKMFENNLKQYKLQGNKIAHDTKKVDESLKDNRTKIKQNKQLPWLVSNVVQILDISPEEEDEDGQVDLEEKPEDKCIVVKTSTRNTIFLPVPGLVDSSELRPGQLVGVNKDSYILLQKLPAEYDSRVKSMEL